MKYIITLLILLFSVYCVQAQKLNKQFTLHVGYGYTPYKSLKSETIDFKLKDQWNNFINLVNGVNIKNPIGDDVGFNIDTIQNQDLILKEVFNYSVGAEFLVGFDLLEFSIGAFSGKYGKLPRFNSTFMCNPLLFFNRNKNQNDYLKIAYRLETDLSTPTIGNFNSKQVGIISDWSVWINKKENIGFIISLEAFKGNGNRSQDNIFTKLKFNF